MPQYQCRCVLDVSASTVDVFHTNASVQQAAGIPGVSASTADVVRTTASSNTHAAEHADA
eukprot:1163062-Rhodomonas_salina.1